MFIHDTKYRRDGEEYVPTYVCDKCGRKITDYRPTRMTEGLYDSKSQQYRTQAHYDFCDRCWGILEKWLNTPVRKKDEECTKESKTTSEI